jgi:NAD(P)-dependent dehydrogenase (short-subunit alcohol dehydrogenase family)
MTTHPGSMQGRVAVVTGAARGIGRAICERFAAEGARVAGLDVSPHRMAAAALEMRAAGFDVQPYVVDIANREAVHAVMQRIEADLGAPVTVLVNNAVYARYQALADIDEETVDRMLAVGMKGMLWATQAAVPQMQRAGGGAVINLSSAAAIQSFENSSVYCALKAGVAGLTRSLAAEFGRQNIRVNAIAPGMIATPASVGKFDPATLAARAKHMPMGRFGQPEEIASAAVFLATAASSYMNGALMMVDGAATVVGT